jgi:hypothetical protein
MKRDVDGRGDRYLNTERKSVRNGKPGLKTTKGKRQSKQKRHMERERIVRPPVVNIIY